MKFNEFKITETQFNSKQEVIAHFVKQGKSAASGAAAWERGWRGPKPKDKPPAKSVRNYHDDLDDKRYSESSIESLEAQLAEAALGTEPRRPARAGSRPARGHNTESGYKTHISPDGVKTNMAPTDDDYQINYGPGGAVAADRKARGVDVATGTHKVNELDRSTLKKYIKAAGKDVEQRASSQSFKSGQAGDKYNKADPTHRDIRREKGIDRALDKLTREQSVDEECAGVGIVTKQNSTADVGPGTIKKNLKAFSLAQEGHDNDEYVQQLTSEFIRRAKLGRRYTSAETILGLLDRFFKKFGISDQYFDDVFHRAVRTTDHEAGILEMETSLEEWKASRQLCRSSTPDSELGASALSSCKSQGLRARDGNKSHKLGKSPKSRTKMGGHRIKGKKYGGPLPDWS